MLTEARSLAPLIRVLSGFAFPSEFFSTEEGVPLVRIRDLGRDTTETRYAGPFRTEYVVRAGDTLVGMDGDFACVRWAGPEGLLNQRVCRIDSVSQELDNDYLFFTLQPLLEEIHNKTPQTTVRHLAPGDVKKQRLKLPTLVCQHRIAEILSTVDEAIEGTEKLIAKHQQIKAGLMHDLFTRGLTPDGRLRSPHTEAPGLYKDSPLGPIPKEWEARSMGHVIAFITDYRGKTPPYSNEGIPAISAENIGDGKIKSITKYVTQDVYEAWTTRGFPEPGDTLFTTEAPVAGIARLPSDQTYLLTRRIIGLRPKPEVDKGILFWQMYYMGVKGVWNRVIHGSTVPRILKPDILRQPIAVPSWNEQLHISSRLDAVECRLQYAEEGLSKLASMKRGLMHDLLTGEVEVSAPDAPGVST